MLEMKQKLKNKDGITLVALIITIIILVILAAVTIEKIFDINLMGTTINGAQNYSNSQIKEKQEMDRINNKIEESIDKFGKEPVKANINIPSEQFYKYNTDIELNIEYVTQVPIDKDTIIANETIILINKNGANAQIKNIENTEKSSKVIIGTGNSSGEVIIQLTSQIKNKKGEALIEQESKEIFIGSEMQRKVENIKIEDGITYAGSIDGLIDGDLESSWCSSTYSWTLEFTLKRNNEN